MPLCSFHRLLGPENRPRACIACCSVYNLESIQGVIAAAEAERAPVMLSVGNEAARHAGLAALGRASLHAAREACVPALVHLNHGRSMDLVLKALDHGFRSVMFDGSLLPLEENIQHTRYAVRLAHEAGAAIEGELGPLPGPGDAPGPTGEKILDRALRFVRETRIDVLAVSVPAGGLADPDHVRLLARALPVPLCVHGASGLGPDGAGLLASLGAAKINFHSEIKAAMRQGLLQDAGDALAMTDNAKQALVALVRDKLRDIGASGTADALSAGRP